MIRRDAPHLPAPEPVALSPPPGASVTPGEEYTAAFASPLSEARRLDALCARFEAEWRAGQAPRIEAFLQEFSGSSAEQARLLLELLALEVELKESAGEPVSIGMYHERFADHGDVVERVFGDRSSSPGERPATGRLEQAFGTGLEPPRRFGDYELLGELARGGMGVVYRARQVSLNRVVALKMILSGQFASESEIRRFRAEALAAAHLDHPNIVPIFEVGRHQGHAFFSMKLIGGGNLAHRLGRYRDDHEATARLMATIASAIHHAHRKGLIHRDLKPSNILIDELGQPLIADFGLVKRASDASSLTASGALLGTPAYMAPEQISGEETTPATDIYSLGAVFYQILTGRPPFRGGGVAETLEQVLERDPVPPRQLRPSIPRELEFICLRCLEKDPRKRYPTAAALAADLNRYLQGEELHAGPTSLVTRLRRWARRESEVACRLVGQGLILALTQVNFLINPAPDVAVHLATTAVELLWLCSSLLLRRVARNERHWELIRMAWITLDVAILAAILRILGAADSSLIVGFPMLIAASGLWNRVRLVWLTTALSMLGYLILATDAWLRDAPRDRNDHPDIVLAGLAVTGLVIAQQLRRIRALSAAKEPANEERRATHITIEPPEPASPTVSLGSRPAS